MKLSKRSDLQHFLASLPLSIIYEKLNEVPVRKILFTWSYTCKTINLNLTTWLEGEKMLNNLHQGVLLLRYTIIEINYQIKHLTQQNQHVSIGDNLWHRYLQNCSRILILSFSRRNLKNISNEESSQNWFVFLFTKLKIPLLRFSCKSHTNE